ncbi:tripartite tricarboxylate transporter TctB family protein [Alkalihalobacillus sp. R86527]|uniref:tripartite tricarboxylate transporter TctB family protein n=1 Tax=Alkalihalobacillus sp. R86527 TaxID=3093863 RepID=UPI00366F11B9
MLSVKRDLINSLVILLFCGLAYYGSSMIPERSLGKTEGDFFPNIIIFTLTFLSLLLLIKSIYQSFKLEKENKNNTITVKDKIKENRKVIITFLLFGLYILVMPYIGYFVSSVTFLFLLYLLLSPHKKKLWQVFLGILGVTYLLSFIFQKFLLVFLPTGVLF